MRFIFRLLSAALIAAATLTVAIAAVMWALAGLLDSISSND